MNRRHPYLSTLTLCALALCVTQTLPAQLSAPKAGVVRYSDGTVHAVYGLPANYIVGSQVLASADAVSFSDRGGIVAKNGRILLVDPSFHTLAEYDSGESSPLLNIDEDLTSAVAWLPTQRSLVYWTGSAFVAVAVNGSAVTGAVTSVWLANERTAKMIAANPDGGVSQASVSLRSGELTSLDALPGIRETAFHQQSFLVFQDANVLTIASPSAVVRTLSLPASQVNGQLKFERMSSNALHVFFPGTNLNWVLHLGASVAPQLAQLPANSTATVTASSLPSQGVQK